MCHPERYWKYVENWAGTKPQVRGTFWTNWQADRNSPIHRPCSKNSLTCGDACVRRLLAAGPRGTAEHRGRRSPRSLHIPCRQQPPVSPTGGCTLRADSRENKGAEYVYAYPYRCQLGRRRGTAGGQPTSAGCRVLRRVPRRGRPRASRAGARRDGVAGRMVRGGHFAVGAARADVLRDTRGAHRAAAENNREAAKLLELVASA